MKKNNILKSIYALIVLLLLGGCIYFYNESTKPDVNILIGTPVSEDRINYGSPIKDKDVVNEIYLGLIHANSIDKPQIAKNLPNAAICINDKNIGIGYLFAEVWVDNDKVIFALGGKNSPYGAQYKELKGSWAQSFVEYISKYK